MSLDSVLLIGGSGFLGLHLIQQFYEQSPRPQIHVFDVRPLPEILPSIFTFKQSEIKFHQGDLTSPDDVKKAIRESKAPVIVHSASPMHGLNQEIYIKVNIKGTENLIKCAKEEGVKAVVYTSSAGVIFNGQNIHNADESWPIPEVPMDGYNETKAIAEKFVLDSNDFQARFLTVALRPAGIFGPGDRQLVPGLRSVAKLGQSKFQIGDNNNLFDWTYAGNVADAHVLAAQKLLDPIQSKKIGGEKFFITNDAPTYFWTLARTVWKADGHVEKYNIVLNRPVAILAGYLSQFFSKLSGKEPGLTPFRVKVVCAYRYHNISKAKEILDYKPNVDLEEGIKRTLQWMDETE
ncbi:Sterol-4-alpha-carboxylate 3-dehydrogenase,decarboxylating [Wickerhamomyces ciferrii]|uniref:Sterol-4-alpha-carboxylate 3-dehydrogenase ERG26, decarboxylating n=1 Tax=Wickerhamomyces ciferrii (strain ATCC 14091 / BCRC 22168 / CBS 111 / JCM 3599 / NBRC 0793 / NRRL Y-1031 F-60-10) TaxID=1206466 RepID=K0KBM1_WICCF|nr:Sterol-4-alpha-carboxylate 3-dehydrogenase,decarboxylating [Wickerhamomyces ciferrii]CCH42440.1 Sterol-4-alpha-carboxylate 3-dehydrogenase,decarboxylating [Wickerhamomyces ciferrii]